MLYGIDENFNLVQTSSDTHVPGGMGQRPRPVHESTVTFSPQAVSQSMLRLQKQAKMKAWNAVQSASAALNNAAKKKNYEAAVRAQVLGREAQPAMTREEAMIKKEVMRQKLHGADFNEFEEMPGVSYSAGVHSIADFNNLKPTNPSYANLPVSASGVATITDWPKRDPTQFWNQPVQPPSNVQSPVPQSAYKAAMGLGDYYDEVSDGLVDAQVQFAAQQLAQTTPRTAMGAMPSNEISPLTQSPAQLFSTMFPGYVTLPVIGPVSQVNVAYAGLAIFGLALLSRLRG
jgi:hypothetical protein